MMRTASTLSQGRMAHEEPSAAAGGFTNAITDVNDVCQRHNTAFPRSSSTPLTNLPVAASHHAVTGLFTQAAKHGQLRLPPAPTDRHAEWSARIALWGDHDGS